MASTSVAVLTTDNDDDDTQHDHDTEEEPPAYCAHIPSSGRAVSLAPLFSMMDHHERQAAALLAAQRQVAAFFSTDANSFSSNKLCDDDHDNINIKIRIIIIMKGIQNLSRIRIKRASTDRNKK